MTRTYLRTTWARGFGVLTLCLVAIAGCFYSFDNPVEKDQPGSVGGTVQLQDAVAGQTTLGGHVSVPWTNGLSLTLNTFGKFLFQDLPDGTYSLYVDIPPVAANDYPLLLLRTGISMPEVEGSTDSLEIGTLQVPASGLVGGTITPAKAGIVVASFAPMAGNIDAGLGTYEGFSTSTDATGHYQIQLPAGAHVIAASDSLDSALASASIQPAATQNLDLTLEQTFLTGVVYGQLIGTGFGASSTGSPFDVDYVATESGVVFADGGFIPKGGANRGGSQFNVTVPGGDFVTITLLPPPSASPDPCDVFLPFSLPPVPVIAGYDTNLGQVTWLTEAALGANGLGPCAPKDGGVSSTGTTGGGTGGTGTTSGGSGTGGGSPWLDAGFIPWDGGQIAQTAIFPLTPQGGRLVAWAAGGSAQYNLYYATSSNGYVPIPLTDGGNVQGGTISGTQLNDGVLLSFSTVGASNLTDCQFISSATGAAQAVVPNFPTNVLVGLGTEETTTFSGALNGVEGAFVLQPEIVDAGIVGAFTTDGISFGNTFTLSPETTAPIIPLTLIATRCAVTDLSGEDGFCLAGSGELNDPDAGPEFVAFISSVETSGNNPFILNTQILSTSMTPPVYIGLATLTQEVAVVAGTFSSPTTYWQLSSLASAPGPGIQAPPQTDLLIDWDGEILGLSWANFNRTAGIFLPDGGQVPAIQGLGNGSDLLTGFYEPVTDSIIIGGNPLTDDGNITIWQLPNQGGD